jgi:hypothetical protein
MSYSWEWKCQITGILEISDERADIVQAANNEA